MILHSLWAGVLDPMGCAELCSKFVERLDSLGRGFGPYGMRTSRARIARPDLGIDQAERRFCLDIERGHGP